MVYEIFVEDAVFSAAGNKVAMFKALQAGRRPDVPDHVLPATKQLIEKCWAPRAETRPGFSEIWSYLAKLKFYLCENVVSADVQAFVRWAEGQVPRQTKPSRKGK
jgi:hypothetical protein